MTKRTSTADQLLVRQMNMALLLDALRKAQPTSRARLAAQVGLNRSTVSSIITELLEMGLVCETELQVSKNGRPGMLLELNPNAGCALGVDINVDFIGVVLADFTMNVRWRRYVRSNPEDPERVIIGRAMDMASEALAECDRLGLRQLGIGIGVPGLVDEESGVLRFAPNLHWRNVPLREMWARRFNLPVFLENDANAALLGEHFCGVARGVDHLFYLNASRGLGGAVMVDGRLMRGASGFAGEVGHMKVDPEGRECGCGRRGCWETVAGQRAVAIRVGERIALGEKSDLLADLVVGDQESLNFAVAVEAAEKGDLLALDVLTEIGTKLGMGLANLVNVLNPQMIVLGGALSLASPFLLPEIERVIQEKALPELRQGLRVEASANKNDACLIGGVAMVLTRLLREPTLVRSASAAA